MRAAFEQRILKAMADADGKPVRWGLDDCTLFVANIIRDVLGYDPAIDWRGRYCSRGGAGRLLAPLGLGFVARSMMREHGWKRIAPEDARPGDPAVTLLPTDKGRPAVSALICRAPNWFVARSECGFVALRPSVVRLAWSVI